MKTYFTLVALTLTLLFVSCIDEDPGPRQSDTRTFPFVDFNRVEAGYGLILNVTKGNTFLVEANGDRRNLDDLVVLKSGNSLILGFKNSDRRQYHTTINITMPQLEGVNFSGAVNGTVNGFTSTATFDITLSGASLAQMNISSADLMINLSGASQLRLVGSGEKMNGLISGASLLSSFDYPVKEATLNLSGASNCRVNVSQQIKGTVSGASLLLYRGEPGIDIESSGESMVRKD